MTEFCIFSYFCQSSADGSSEFAPEKDRYHLFVSLACPWAHRTLMVRVLKGLEDVLPYTVVDWFLTEEGWKFTDKVKSYFFTFMAIKGVESRHSVNSRMEVKF
jgi:glutathionyl-hydroquinone reductase